MMADPELFSVPSKSKTDMLRRVVAEHRRIPLAVGHDTFSKCLVAGWFKKAVAASFFGHRRCIVVLLPRLRTHIHADSANKLLVDLIEIMWELPRSGN